MTGKHAILTAFLLLAALSPGCAKEAGMTPSGAGGPASENAAAAPRPESASVPYSARVASDGRTTGTTYETVTVLCVDGKKYVRTTAATISGPGVATAIVQVFRRQTDVAGTTYLVPEECR